MAISTIASTNGTATGTSITITLPTYLLTDYIVLVVASNNGNTQTFGANVTATPLATASNRLMAYRIVPSDDSQTTFTMTVGVNSVFTWWMMTYRGSDISAVVNGLGINIGNNTTSAIAVPTVSLSYISTGNELVVSAASVNSTATWTTSGSTVYNTTSGNAALLVNNDLLDADVLSAVSTGVDRGIGGTARNESALAFVLQEAPIGEVNLLGNPSFELGTTVATGWESEKTTSGAPAYAVGTIGVSDGDKSQNIQYAGLVGDSGTVFALYQAPIDAVPGDTLEFSIDISGTVTDAVMIAGIEDFQTGGTYISETDVAVTGLSGTPQTFTVQHTCDTLTDYVAVFIQVNEIYDASSINVNLDRAILRIVPSGTTGQIKVWDGSTFVAKPVKVWNGSTWTTKPLKHWNGSAWIEGGY